MKIPEVNIIFRFFDILLWPFMYILGGFNFPVQETHAWHVKKWNWNNSNGLVIRETEKNAKFGHEAPFGLFHMPIFGGLSKYVVIEASGYNKYWHIGWNGFIHKLPIKQNKIALLVGKKGLIAYGLGDNKNNLKLKVVVFGEIGDKKYNDIRLF